MITIDERKHGINLFMKNIGGNAEVKLLIPKNHITLIVGGNAKGKTSIVKGIATIVPSPYFYDASLVKKEGTRNFLVEFKLDDTKITFPNHNDSFYPNSDNAFLVSFVTEDNKLMYAIRSGNQQNIKKWFEKISSTRYYEIVLNSTNRLIKECQSAITSLENSQKTLPRQLDLIAQRSSFRQNLRSVNDELNSIEDISTRLKESKKLLIQNQADITDRQRAIRVIKNSGTYSLGAGENKISRSIKTGINAYQRKLTQNSNAMKKTRQELQDKKTEYETEEERLLEIAEVVETTERAFNEIKQLDNYADSRDIKNEMDVLEIEIDQLHHVFNSGLNLCSHCGQSLESIKPEKMERLNEIEERREELSELVEIIINAQKTYNQAKNHYETTQKHIQNLRVSHRTFNEQLAILNRERRELDQKVNELTEKLTQFQAEIGEIQADVTAMKHDIEQIEISERYRSFEIVKNRKEDIHAQLRKLEARLERVNYVSSHLKHYQNSLSKLASLKVEIENQYTVHVEYYSKDLNKLLGEVMDRLVYRGLNITFESGEFKILRDGSEISLHNLSGAEKQTIGLVLLYVCHRAFVEFPLFIIDDAIVQYDDDRLDWFIKFLSEEIRIRDDFNYCLVTSSRTSADQRLEVEWI